MRQLTIDRFNGRCLDRLTCSDVVDSDDSGKRPIVLAQIGYVDLDNWNGIRVKLNQAIRLRDWLNKWIDEHGEN